MQGHALFNVTVSNLRRLALLSDKADNSHQYFGWGVFLGFSAELISGT
jgi:hypothetical protein